MARHHLRFVASTILAAGTLIPGLHAQSRPTAREVVDRIQREIGAPASKDTVDTFKAGDPDTPVTGIATTFTASLDVLKRAVAAGANLIITHEPTFYGHQDRTEPFERDAVYTEKAAYIREHHLVVWRFHDQLHFRSPDMTVQAMTDTLGWASLGKPGERVLFVLQPTTLGDLAAEIQRKLSAHVVRVVGDPRMGVTMVAFLPGAASEEMQVKVLERDDVEVLIAGESREWETVEYVRDAVSEGRRKALILLGHVVSEEPGMDVAARWLRTRFPALPVQFIPAAEPFWAPQPLRTR